MFLRFVKDNSFKSLTDHDKKTLLKNSLKSGYGETFLISSEVDFKIEEKLLDN